MEEQAAQDYKDFLSERRHAILEEVHTALAQAGRHSSELCVLAVSKTVDAARMLLAHEAGWEGFAENRPQELVRKYDAISEAGLAGQLRLDMIGNLQKNKINQILGRVELIHSISSEHLAEAVAKRACARGRTEAALLEVNVSGEMSKSGFSEQEIREALPRLCELEGISIQGLMSMAPAGNRDRARRCFARLRELRDELAQESGLALGELSCGMSDDFREAIQEGSTIIRLGRVVFDPAYAFEGEPPSFAAMS